MSGLARWTHMRFAFSYALIAIIATSGCTSFWQRDSKDSDGESHLRELMKVPDPPKLVREAAVPRGMRPINVHGVGLVNSLANTGGPADPSSLRDQLLEEMRRNGVSDPNQILELQDTALVQVTARIPAGARRGDPLDLEVVAPPRSRVSDLHGGWLLDTRMRHRQVLDSSVRQSDVLAMATGAVVTRANCKPGQDASLKTEARVLGGGLVQSERKLGLILRPEYQHVKMASRIAEAINRRFFFFDGSTRRGIAKAVEDDYIEIEVHPRYRGNEYRMMAVILALSPDLNAASTQLRLSELAKQLSNPVTASDASLQLEGLGEDAIPTLTAGVESLNEELRFYAAETLAYLDQTAAIGPLEMSIRQEPAFRHSALTAMEGITNPLAADALERLFDEASMETRYGAFVALRKRDDAQRRLHGQAVADGVMLYDIPSKAAPAIAVSLKQAPEIVLFGDVQDLQINGFLRGPSGLILKPDTADPSLVRISRFRPGNEDRRVVVSNSIEDVIRGIGQVGGGYGDLIQVLREAKEKGFLADQLAFDPLPEPLRTYYRDEERSDE